MARGGKREGAGSKPKPESEKKQTVVVRVPVDLVPVIEEMKRSGLNSVTGNQTARDFEAEIAVLNAANTRLVMERDSEHAKALALQSQIERLKRDTNTLYAEIDRLKHAEHDCQALKSNGERCTRTAINTVNWHGVVIHVCSQHHSKLSKT